MMLQVMHRTHSIQQIVASQLCVSVALRFMGANLIARISRLIETGRGTLCGIAPPIQWKM